MGSVLCCLVLVVASAGAQTLSAAEKAFEDLEFAEAAALYREALKKPGTREERIRAYRGLGLSLAFLGDAKEAQANFERLLWLEPEARVNTALGPKISGPFEAAKRATVGRPATLELTRDAESGELVATLTPPLDFVDRLELHVPPRTARSRGAEPVRLGTNPEKEIHAWATALDAKDGVLLEAGTPSAPLTFPAVALRHPAVASVVDEARVRQETEPDGEPGEASGSAWPLWVGGAAVVIGGGVAAAILMQPPAPLRLPAADRTGRLP